MLTNLRLRWYVLHVLHKTAALIRCIFSWKFFYRYIFFGLSGINKLYLVHICAIIWIHFSNVAEMCPLLSPKMTLSGLKHVRVRSVLIKWCFNYERICLLVIVISVHGYEQDKCLQHKPTFNYILHYILQLYTSLYTSHMFTHYSDISARIWTR